VHKVTTERNGKELTKMATNQGFDGSQVCVEYPLLNHICEVVTCEEQCQLKSMTIL
jgi:hypothetical protein